MDAPVSTIACPYMQLCRGVLRGVRLILVLFVYVRGWSLVEGAVSPGLLLVMASAMHGVRPVEVSKSSTAASYMRGSPLVPQYEWW